MKWTEAKVIFDYSDKELAADLIADIFNEFGLQGVVIEDPDEEPSEGWGDGAVEKPANNSVAGYFPSNSSLSNKCAALEKKLKELESKSGISWHITYSEIDEKDWAESWKAFFWPVKIGKNLVVKPTWREYAPGKNDIILEIDPGMAFGTGAHPTSALCMSMIEKYLKPGNSFLDIGTGSGILMIAAAKLGAGHLLGTDTDEVAAEIAKDNLILNKIDEKRFAVKISNLVEEIGERFDVVAANILSEVILTLLDSVSKVISKNGILICSGITEKNRSAVEEKMTRKGFEIIDVQTSDGWVCIAGRLQS
ncbi:MAG: 50S ribosomal protein L11 methyltransferase [Proteobacteria bacterium]|nr:50S ribosomal protein L11 methyltransferase [Pseudomonadota bacterium]